MVIPQRVDGLPDPKFDSDIQPDDTTHATRIYGSICYLYNEALWGEGRKDSPAAPKCADRVTWCPEYLGGLVFYGA